MFKTVPFVQINYSYLNFYKEKWSHLSSVTEEKLRLLRKLRVQVQWCLRGNWSMTEKKGGSGSDR